MKLIKLMGATVTDKENGEREYKPRGPVWIRPDAVTAVYEHMVRTEHHQFVVMQTCDEILRRLNSGRAPGQGAVVVEYSEGHMPPQMITFSDRAAKIEERLDVNGQQIEDAGELMIKTLSRLREVERRLDDLERRVEGTQAAAGVAELKYALKEGPRMQLGDTEIRLVGVEKIEKKEAKK